MGYYLGEIFFDNCVNMNGAPRMCAHRRAGLARGAVMPRRGVAARGLPVGVMRSVWRTGGPSPGFKAFSSSPYTVPLCWVWGPGIAVLFLQGLVLL